MKKLYFHFLCVAVFFLFGEAASAQVTLIPDPAFEQVLITNGYDTVLDGEVLTANISGMYSLDLYDLGITDLTGIQNFTNLHNLFLYQNNLTTLDVSNLQSLQMLNCGNNNLTNLNVAGLANLEMLVCGQNSLTTLDLTGLTNLKEIHSSSMPSLTQVSVSSPNLNYIDFRGCGLTSFDATGFSLLETLIIDENNLASLQVNGISTLSSLYCYHNELTSLNLTGTNLTTLYCSFNKLTSLSLKGQDTLDTFDLSNNPFLSCIEVDDVAAMEAVAGGNKDGSAEYRTDCNVIIIPDDAFESALIALGYDDVMDNSVQKPAVTGITSLDISGKDIWDLTGIEGFTSLTELNCSNNNIDGTAFSSLTGLIKLNCSNNPLYGLDLSLLTNLEELNCSDSELYSFDMGSGSSLKKLDCHTIGMDSLNFGNLTNLEWLDCSQNGLANLDLQNNNSLNYLDCSHNNIANVAFNSDNPLEYMYCNDNNLFRVETFQLPNLKELICNNNSIYDISIENLPNLTILDCSNNQISNTWLGTLTQLETFMCGNNNIQTLQLFGFENLTLLDCNNNNLTFLNIKGTNITNLDCTTNSLSCISMDNPEITIDNPNFQKDETAAFESSCQTGPFTLIPDVNFEKKLIAGSYDETIDGQVPTEVISQISFFSLYQAGVSDLTGIQDFTSLSSLDLQDNNLTDLNALNGMDWIQNLYCSENPFVNLDLDGLSLSGVETFYCTNSTLETINFGDGMPNITELYIYENQLVSLDLSSLENLYYIECNDNQLATLNITGLENLEEINCSNNRLTAIDLTGIINLGDLNCSNNQITELDFSETPAIWEIDCNDNNITQLDVSGHFNLYNLECSNNSLTQLNVSGAENLESLYCSNNQLTSLELDSNYIYDVECSGNRLTTLDLSNVGGVNSLYCNDNQLVSLTLHPSIGYLECKNNLLTSIDVSNTESLYGMSIDSNYFSAIDLTELDLYYFSALDNEYLKCIKVIDPEEAESDGNWTINGDSYYATECNSCGNATLWNETEWFPAAPDSESIAFIKGAFTITDDMEFCSLVLLENANMNVPSGKNIQVSGILDVDTTAALAIDNNANLIQSGNLDENRGAITVTRNAVMRRLDYVYWSSPVKDRNLLAFSEETLPNRFYTLNEATNQFAAIDPAISDFLPAHGYMIRAANTFPPNGSLATFNGIFNGTPNNADIDVDVFHTEDKGFNLIGNPYPSAIDADAFMDANPDIDALYFWTHASQIPNSSNYATYNASGGAQAATTAPDDEPNGAIQVGQGFLAKMTSEAPQQVSVHFTNGMRVANNENQFFRSASPIEKNRIWLNLSDTTKKLNQILTGYITNATNGIDSRYDGKLIETAGSKLYNLIGNSEYVIQAKALPFTSDDVVALGFKAETAGNFIISLDHADGLFNGNQDIFIKDNLTGAVHDIHESAYAFASEAGTFNNRFEIVYQSSLGIKTPVSGNIVLFNKNQALHIDSGIEMMREVKIFDIRGRLIYEKKTIGSNTLQITDLKAQDQVLLVQIKLEDQTTITKKAIY